MTALVLSPWKKAEACLGKTMHYLTDFLFHGRELIYGSENDFVYIERGLKKMHLMLKSVDAERGAMQDNNDAWEVLLKDIRLLASHIEAVTDCFILRKRGIYTLRSIIKMTTLVFKAQTAGCDSIDDLTRIKLLILRLIDRGSALGLKPIEARTDLGRAFLNLPLLSPDDMEKGETVGLEEDMQIIVSQLVSGNETRGVVVILGASGIGKTALARKVYDNTVIAQHFPCCAWLNLSQEFDLIDIVQTIAKQLKKGCESEETVWTQETINGFLSCRRYLIVLDNLATSRAWDSLQELFPKTLNGGRILVTTRERAVAQSAEPDPGLGSIYHMRRLSDEESWALFKAKVLVPVELEQIGQGIVKKCMGLPLAILTAGDFLQTKPATSDQWSAVVKQIDNDLVSNYNSLNSAVDALPSYLKQCLLYFGLFFKEDYDIPVRRLILLWIAEGLVPNNNKPPEYVAEKYLTELINLKMIQVCKRKPDGRVKSCRLHYLLRDQWVSKAREANFIHNQSKATGSKLSSNKGSLCRPTDHLDVKDHSEKNTNDSLRSYYGYLRSFISFNQREGVVPGEDLGNFLRRSIGGKFFKELRVIDLEGEFRTRLPEQIGKLIQLRYLGLRYTYLEMLPSSIGNLENLQSLDLKHTCISNLPSSLWKMQQLRHLYLSDSYRIRFVAPLGASPLVNLRTLRGAFIDEESPVEYGLDKLRDLRKLGLVCRLSSSQKTALARWIARLRNLESLRLRSIDESVQPSDLYLETLAGLQKLSNVYLLGRLEDPAVVHNFPKCITEITLSLSGLKADPMPKLGKLPNLRILRLFSSSYTGKIMVCSEGGFPLLRILKLWKLEDLEEWRVEKGALTIVKEIEIRSCKKLMMIPDGLQHLVHCRELTLKSMPEEFKTRIIENQGQDWYKIAHIPSVHIEK